MRTPLPAAGGASFEIARDGSSVYVRAIGLANMKVAPTLDAFLRGSIEQGVNTVCVDLSSCTGMDSTFMGLLVGQEQDLAARGGRLAVVRPSETARKLLDLLGVSTVVPVILECVAPEVAFVPLPAEASQSTLERMELIRRAHRDLIELNAANRAKFAAFLTALEADLAKLKPPSPVSPPVEETPPGA